MELKTSKYWPVYWLYVTKEYFDISTAKINQITGPDFKILDITYG